MERVVLKEYKVIELVGANNESDALFYVKNMIDGREAPHLDIDYKVWSVYEQKGKEELAVYLRDDVAFNSIYGSKLYVVSTHYEVSTNVPTPIRGDNRGSELAPNSQGSSQGSANPEFGNAPTEA